MSRCPFGYTAADAEEDDADNESEVFNQYEHDGDDACCGADCQVADCLSKRHGKSPGIEVLDATDATRPPKEKKKQTKVVALRPPFRAKDCANISRLPRMHRSRRPMRRTL